MAFAKTPFLCDLLLMKKAISEKNNITQSTVELVVRLVKMVQWPQRRMAMWRCGDVAKSLLNGKSRASEEVFGLSWQPLPQRCQAFCPIKKKARNPIVQIRNLALVGHRH